MAASISSLIFAQCRLNRTARSAQNHLHVAAKASFGRKPYHMISDHYCRTRHLQHTASFSLFDRRADVRSRYNDSSQIARRNISLPNPFNERYNFRRLDKVTPKMELVYKNTLNNYVIYFYPICMATAVFAVIQAAIILMQKTDLHTHSAYLEGMKLVPLEGVSQVLCTSAFAVFIASVFTVVAQRCVLRIYYDHDEQLFTLIFGAAFPWKIRKMTVACGAVKCVYPLEETSDTLRTFLGEYVVGSRRLIIYPDYFKLPCYFNMMLGFGA